MHEASPHDPEEVEPEPGDEKVLSFGVDAIVVTASPLATTPRQVAQAVSVLEGQELLLSKQATIGEGSLAYYLSGFGLTAGDISIPGFARSKQLRELEPLPPGEEAKGTLPNSAVSNTGFATGLSWVEEDFYVGVAPSLYRTSYGIVAEPDVTVDLSQNRLDVAAGVTDPVDYVHSIEAKARVVDYHHTEFEGDAVGTVFSNRGYDLRIEAVHHRLGLFDGALGFQSFRSDFSALGEEAFLPVTLTSSQSVFILEEMHLDPLSSEQSATLDSSYTQRPPNYEELYANGPHVALGRFGIGNPDFGSERSMGFNLAYLGSIDAIVWAVNGFYNRFWNFLTLFPTGAVEDGFQVEMFEGIPADFAGGEAELAFHVIDDAVQRLHVVGCADYVWAENRDTGAPLPRMPPLRFGGSVIYEYGAFHAQFDALRARAQDRVPDDALPSVGPFDSLVFLRMRNLLDAEAPDAASFLKDVAPLPGRNFGGGVQVSF